MNFGAQRGPVTCCYFFMPTPASAIRFRRYSLGVAGSESCRRSFRSSIGRGAPYLQAGGFMISLRSRISKVGTGDQAIFVRREIFAELGGYPDIPLMEDLAFAQALKRRGAVACLRSRVVTSARRWEREGIWGTIFKMWMLKSLYLVGISPVRLKRYYGDTR
jgi:hypothetical protein